MLLAFELVADRQSMRPLPAEMNAHIELVEEAYSRGLIIYSRRTRGGLEGDHFMVCPPLIVEDAQLEEILYLLTASLDALADRLGLGQRWACACISSAFPPGVANAGFTCRIFMSPAVKEATVWRSA